MARIRKITMISAVLAFAFLIMASTMSLADTAADNLIGQAAPFLAFKDSTGQDISIGNGKAAIVYFWQTNCAPCSTLIPFLNRMHETYSDKGLVVIGIGVMENAARSQKYKSEKGVKYPLIPDPQGKITIGFGITLTPTTYIIRPDGKVSVYKIGYKETDDAAYEASIKAFLGL